jgi:SAM-dependent methyltransferase
MENSQIYTAAFQQQNTEGQLQTDEALVRFLRESILISEPQTICDVGCGGGRMLAEWIRQGVTDITGIDGNYIEPQYLKIPRERFIARDLRTPFKLGQRFDLVTSFEVAEHLEPQYADGFVDLLCSFGDVIVFSAAIPRQGGDGHYNEQWQSFWAEKFASRGYSASRVIPETQAENTDITAYYVNNGIVYYNKNSSISDLVKNYAVTELKKLNGIIPRYWESFGFWLAKRLIDKAVACRIFDDIKHRAANRSLVVWGVGLNGVMIDFFCNSYGYFPERVFVDTYKEANNTGRIPVAPISSIEQKANKYYILVSLDHNAKSEIRPQIEQALNQLAYDVNDYCWMIDYCQ